MEPLTRNAIVVVRTTETPPAMRAAIGLAPTSLTRNPAAVRALTNQAIAHAPTARMKPKCNRVSGTIRGIQVASGSEGLCG